MGKHRSENSTLKALEHKATIARQQRVAQNFSSEEESKNTRSLLYSYPPNKNP